MMQCMQTLTDRATARHAAQLKNQQTGNLQLIVYFGQDYST